MAEIRGKCDVWKKEKGLESDRDRLYPVDAGFYFDATGESTTTDFEVSRQLKGLAKGTGCTYYCNFSAKPCISQRDNTMNTKEPDLSHLRESGALEQDADVVLLFIVLLIITLNWKTRVGKKLKLPSIETVP